MKVFVVVETCCYHFIGVFATEEEAKKYVEKEGDGYSILEEEI